MVDGFFDGEFVKTFLGPDGEKLFIDRGAETRLFFALNVDFFNVNTVLAHNATTSCGIISMSCLNLPPSIRYRTENMYLMAVIPGPDEPSLNRINHFLHPLIDELALLWDPGVIFSRTATSRDRLVRAALAVCICDLPAARKVAGLVGHGANHFCSVCTCHDRKRNLGRTDFTSWIRRDDHRLRTQAEKWRDAISEQKRNTITNTFGVRWSVMWNLKYWSPSKQLVPDPMHCLLENLASHHFRDFLRLTTQNANTKQYKPPAFTYPFQMYNPNYSSGEVLDITSTSAADRLVLVGVLQAMISITADMLSSNPFVLHKKLEKLKLLDLQTVCAYLGVQPIRGGAKGKRAATEADYLRGLTKRVSE